LNYKKYILFIRLSSLGDVALSVPVIQNFLLQNPDVKVSILSKSFHAPLFSHLQNIHFIAFDTNEYKGLIGLYKFVKTNLFTKDFTHIIDLHDVLRTKIIRFFYTFKKVSITSFDKGRNEKKQAIKNKSIQNHPLIHVTERYAMAISDAGFNCELNDREEKFDRIKKDKYTIGIAPLSKHFTKNFPLEKMQELIQQLMAKGNIDIKILCASSERSQLEFLCDADNVRFLNEENSLSKDIEDIKKLDLIISMDSANMHIANIFKIPVLTIWGGTHPNIGFSGYYKNNTINIQNDLSCRPCSIYGRSDCPVGHFKCMKELSSTDILNSIYLIIS
jgi:ADP-heptose:LPS heptosyltransferase